MLHLTNGDVYDCAHFNEDCSDADVSTVTSETICCTVQRHADYYETPKNCERVQKNVNVTVNDCLPPCVRPQFNFTGQEGDAK